MSWRHLSDTKPKARKQHICYLCGQSIDKGEVHVVRTGVLDGEMLTDRMHLDCKEITKSWTMDDWEAGHDPVDFLCHKNERAKESTL